MDGRGHRKRKHRCGLDQACAYQIDNILAAGVPDIRGRDDNYLLYTSSSLCVGPVHDGENPGTNPSSRALLVNHAEIEDVWHWEFPTLLLILSWTGTLEDGDLNSICPPLYPRIPAVNQYGMSTCPGISSEEPSKKPLASFASVHT